MAEIGMGTLYDWNKSAVGLLEPLKSTDLKDKMRAIKEKTF